jgi:D-tyrosyl-tRNA(Tyr) deacylase
MRTVVQRVSKASVHIDGRETARIGQGLLVLLGIEEADTEEDARWLVHKLHNLRIFSDSEDKMNLSVEDIGGEVLIVSQFTLHAKTKKGFRPSFVHAAKPEKAVPLYEFFIRLFEEKMPGRIQTGRFGAMMQIHLINDGPVTIIIDTKNKE